MKTWSQRLYDRLLNLQPEPLNLTSQTSLPPIPDLAAQLKISLNALKGAAIDPEQGKVNYAYLATSPLYADYRHLSAHLQHFDLHQLATPAEKLAFWINLYNVLIIDAIIHYQVKQSVQEVKGFFRRSGYIIGGHFFSADDIEHGILRANAGHPALLTPQFQPTDPRFAFILPDLDYRIHFALVCGAESCPPINFYQAGQIERQLELATHNFLNGSNVHIDMIHGEVRLSKILGWYAADFGGSNWNVIGLGSKTPVLQKIAPYISDPQQRAFLEDNAAHLRVRYHPYDWSLNH